MLAVDHATELRQGDVCTVPFFPRWVSNSPTVVGDGGISAVQMSGWSAVRAAEDGSAMVVVCSHDCDVENPRARTGLLLAPVIKVPARPNTDEYQTIMSSHTPVNEAMEFINLFPLVLEDSSGAKDVVVDFSAIISFGPPRDTSESLNSTKMFEMTDAERRLFKMKLAAFVGRG